MAVVLRLTWWPVSPLHRIGCFSEGVRWVLQLRMNEPVGSLGWPRVWINVVACEVVLPKKGWTASCCKISRAFGVRLSEDLERRSGLDYPGALPCRCA